MITLLSQNDKIFKGECFFRIRGEASRLAPCPSDSSNRNNGSYQLALVAAARAADSVVSEE